MYSLPLRKIGIIVVRLEGKKREKKKMWVFEKIFTTLKSYDFAVKNLARHFPLDRPVRIFSHG